MHKALILNLMIPNFIQLTLSARNLTLRLSGYIKFFSVLLHYSCDGEVLDN